VERQAPPSVANPGPYRTRPARITSSSVITRVSLKRRPGRDIGRTHA
jgi:hypothetical protein